jgi:ferrochelatase
LFHWDVAFQSRLGPTRWLSPSLLEVTDNLLEQGVKVMIVQCPSFVFDCLETLEEVGQEVKAHFLRNGGKDFILVPAPNHSPEWLKTLKCMILEQMGVSYETCASSASPTPP